MSIFYEIEFAKYILPYPWGYDYIDFLHANRPTAS